MNDRLRFEVNDNQGRFVFPDTWFGPLPGEFEKLLDTYDTGEISETSYINMDLPLYFQTSVIT